VYTATKQQQEARQQYESAIRRPYWHVKPLDAAQLRNWAAYLDWQEAQGDMGLTVRLYERCCVPCASYPGARMYTLDVLVSAQHVALDVAAWKRVLVVNLLVCS
jgi:hypothetical protein